jgi:hypothetical protein
VAGAPQTLEVRAVDSTTGQALVFATFTATTSAGPPATAAALAGDTAVVGVPGSAVEDSFAVLVRDQYGNPVPGAQVAWAVTSGGGSITATTTTDAAGIARTQWVLGPAAGSAIQGAQATAGGATVRFIAYPVTVLTRLAGDGAVQGAGTVVTVTVGTNGPGGLPIHWTVASGGGSVAPSVVRTTEGSATSTASAQWTLGPAGPQTLTASAGSLSVTFTAASVAAGKRTQIANVNGRILDLDPTRVLYVDSTSGPARVARLRTLSSGAEVVVDSGFDGRLTPAGALVVRGTSPTLVEVDAGGVTSLGPVGRNSSAQSLLAVRGSWAAWMTAAAGSVIRRDLATGTNLTVATPITNASRGSVEVGSDGDVVYEYYVGGGFGGNNYVRLYHDGTTTPVFNSFVTGITRPQTDGGNVTYLTVSSSTGAYELWLWRAGNTERLTFTPYSGPNTNVPDSRVAGGWVAYLAVYDPYSYRYTQVRLRTPGGADEALSRAGAPNAGRLEALCPDGSVVYGQGTVSPQGTAYTRRYIAYRGGPLVDAGAYDAGAVVCRGGRFFLFSGGTVYELSQ